MHLEVQRLQGRDRLLCYDDDTHSGCERCHVSRDVFDRIVAENESMSCPALRACCLFPHGRTSMDSTVYSELDG